MILLVIRILQNLSCTNNAQIAQWQLDSRRRRIHIISCRVISHEVGSVLSLPEKKISGTSTRMSMLLISNCLEYVNHRRDPQNSRS